METMQITNVNGMNSVFYWYILLIIFIFPAQSSETKYWNRIKKDNYERSSYNYFLSLFKLEQIFVPLNVIDRERGGIVNGRK